jgi:hypothetical protein
MGDNFGPNGLSKGGDDDVTQGRRGRLKFRTAVPFPVVVSKRDGVDVARAASGSRKSRAKMVVVENNI